MKKSGFTLIELLVVVAIIALLLSVVLPALRAAKNQAYSAACLANQRGLTIAWMTYAQDNSDQLVGPMTDNTGAPDFSWVSQPRDITGSVITAANSTYQDEIRGIERGLLYSYAETPDIFHCPSDTRYLSPPIAGGTGDGGFRSYSLVSGAGPASTSEINWLGYRPHFRLAAIRSPGDKYIMVEEMEGRGMNINSWVLKPQTPDYWIDPISIWHNRSSTLGFADGHSERHRWLEESTIEMAERQANNFYAPGSRDLEYMIRNFPSERNY